MIYKIEGYECTEEQFHQYIYIQQYVRDLRWCGKNPHWIAGTKANLNMILSEARNGNFEFLDLEDKIKNGK